MPPVARIGDICSGHDSFIPSPVIQGSPNVFTNNIKTFRKTDAVQPHPSPSPSPPHARAGLQGSTTVFINNLDCMRIGDPINCGGIVIESSPDVYAGG